jgi:hypothetical protein
MTDRDPIQESGFFRRLSDLTRRGENRRSVGHWIRTRLLVGFMVAFPLVVTIFFARFIFGLMDKWFRPISERIVGEPLVGVGLVVSLLILLLLGVLATNVLGGRLLHYFEKKITGLPLLSPIYQGARQITEAIQLHETAEFQRVVLLPFPNQNVRSLGFADLWLPGGGQARGPHCPRRHCRGRRQAGDLGRAADPNKAHLRQ